MTNKAIIFVDRLTEDAKQSPLSCLKVGGITLLERQLRQLKKVGISQAYLISNRLEELLSQEVKKFKGGPESVDIIKGISLGDNQNVISLFKEDTLLVGVSFSKKVSPKGRGRVLFLRLL